MSVLIKLIFDTDTGFVTTDDLHLMDIFDTLHLDLMCLSTKDYKHNIGSRTFWHPCILLYTIAKHGVYDFFQVLNQIVRFYRKYKELFALVIGMKTRIRKNSTFEESLRGIKLLKHKNDCTSPECRSPCWINVTHLIRKSNFAQLHTEFHQIILYQAELYNIYKLKFNFNNQVFFHGLYYLLTLVQNRDWSTLAAVIDLLLIHFIGNYNYLYNCGCL